MSLVFLGGAGGTVSSCFGGTTGDLAVFLGIDGLYQQNALFLII